MNLFAAVGLCNYSFQGAKVSERGSSFRTTMLFPLRLDYLQPYGRGTARNMSQRITRVRICSNLLWRWQTQLP